MPRILGTQSQQIRVEKNEVKGHDFFTLAGKSQRYYLLEAQNVPNRPKSLKKKSANPIKSTCLLASLSVGAIAALPRASAAFPSPSALSAVAASYNHQSLCHRTLSIIRQNCTAERVQAPPDRRLQQAKKPQSVSPRHDYFPQKTNAHKKLTPHQRHSSFHQKLFTPHSAVSPEAGISVVPARSSEIKKNQKIRTIRQIQHRDEKQKRNEGDEQYWPTVTTLSAWDVAETTQASVADVPLAASQSRGYPLWENTLDKVIAYLQHRPFSGYPTFASNRLDAARIAFKKVEQGSWADEALFNYANQRLDPRSDNYSIAAVRQFIRNEIMMYYVKSRIVDWDLQLSDPHLQQAFLSAYAAHYSVFSPETVVNFYRSQFQRLQRQEVEPFRTRDELGSLKKYYAQFSHYLNNHASDVAENFVEQIAVMQDMSQLDLERKYTALFSLRVGFFQKELLPHSAHPMDKPMFGQYIYILKGDSGKSYAASIWASSLIVTELGDFLTEPVIEAIKSLKNGHRVSPAILPLTDLLAQRWPTFYAFKADKEHIVTRHHHAVEFGIASPTLRDCLIRIQHNAIKQYVNAWREQNLNKTTLEKILSFIPFAEVIQRKINSPEYQPTLKDLAFDLFELGITLLTLGIPLIKVGMVGIKSALLAIKAGRVAGLTGAMLRKAIFTALQPALKKMAKVSLKEIAGFVVPPFDLVRLLHKPVRWAGRKVVKSRKAVGPRRCPRAIGGACVPSTSAIAGFDTNEWDRLLTKLITAPATWHGTVYTRQYRHNYIRSFNGLSLEEKRAIRDWTYIPRQKPYNNYPTKNSAPEGVGNINFQLNSELVKTYPDAVMLRRAANLRNALRVLPELPVRQRLIRVVDIPTNNIQRFSVGDMVSNYPTFMSASAEGRLLNIALHRGALFNPKWINNPDSVIAVYFISAKRAKPLVLRIASQAKIENEYLFEQKSFFKIEAITRLFQASPVRSPKQVYFIRLKQVPYHRTIDVKNIFTGDKLFF